MSIEGLKQKIDRAADVAHAMDTLTSALGLETEFTRKQAETVLRGTGVSFDALVKSGGVTKSREESFTVTVRNDDIFWRYTSLTGRVENFYVKWFATEAVKRYGGSYEEVPLGATYDVEAKRFYYTLTPDTLKPFGPRDIEREKAAAIKKLEKEIIEMRAEIAFLETL